MLLPARGTVRCRKTISQAPCQKKPQKPANSPIDALTSLLKSMNSNQHSYPAAPHRYGHKTASTTASGTACYIETAFRTVHTFVEVMLWLNNQNCCAAVLHAPSKSSHQLPIPAVGRLF
jgi:hypothetical protein